MPWQAAEGRISRTAAACAVLCRMFFQANDGSSWASYCRGCWVWLATAKCTVALCCMVGAFVCVVD